MSTLAAVSFEIHGLIMDQIIVNEEGAFTIASCPMLQGSVISLCALAVGNKFCIRFREVILGYLERRTDQMLHLPELGEALERKRIRKDVIMSMTPRPGKLGIRTKIL